MRDAGTRICSTWTSSCPAVGRFPDFVAADTSPVQWVSTSPDHAQAGSSRRESSSFAARRSDGYQNELVANRANASFAVASGTRNGIAPSGGSSPSGGSAGTRSAASAPQNRQVGTRWPGARATATTSSTSATSPPIFAHDLGSRSLTTSPVWPFTSIRIGPAGPARTAIQTGSSTSRGSSSSARVELARSLCVSPGRCVRAITCCSSRASSSRATRDASPRDTVERSATWPDSSDGAYGSASPRSNGWHSERVAESWRRRARHHRLPRSPAVEELACDAVHSP